MAGYVMGVYAPVVTPGSFDYYISPTGSDSNNGLTTSTPWALTAINTKRATYAGKTVGLMDGTYNVITITGQSTNLSTHDNTLGVAAGSSGSPTIIKAVNPPSHTITSQP